MKIRKIRLENYRGFKQFDLELHPKLTVIMGVNGCGKTTLMSALMLVLWSYIMAYKKDVRGGTPPTISIDDVHHTQPTPGSVDLKFPCSVKGKFDFSESDKFENYFDDDFDEFDFDAIGCELQEPLKKPEWVRGFSVEMEALSKGMDAAFGDLSRLMGERSDHTSLPVVACYGTNRLWKKMAVQKDTDRTPPRLAGYDGAASLRSKFLDFPRFFALLFSSKKNGLLTTETIEALWTGVSDSIFLVAGWRQMLPKTGRPEILFKKDEELLKFSQLGDGVRCMIEVVGDIACRCALLNPEFGKDASKKTSGVVLIDEIDLHLHPKWQQTILSELQRAFPKIQFIVSTHSPQVLSTVRRENIRVLDRNAGGPIFASQPMARTYGEPSGDVLQSVMGVDPQPPIEEKKELQKLTELVDKGRYGEADAIQLMDKLRIILGAEHPQLLKLKRSINRQEALKK